MVLAAVVVGSLSVAVSAPYFPLTPGTTWTFSETTAGLTETWTDTCGGGVQMAPFGEVFRIESKSAGQPTEHSYYQVSGEWVTMVAYVPGKPFAKPMPILPVQATKKSWTYQGVVEYPSGPVTVDFKFQSNPGGERPFTGRRAKTLVVEMTGTITSKQGEKFTTRKVSTYAEGMGLVESETRFEMADLKVDRKRTLTEFKLGASQ